MDPAVASERHQDSTVVYVETSGNTVGCRKCHHERVVNSAFTPKFDPEAGMVTMEFAERVVCCCTPHCIAEAPIANGLSASCNQPAPAELKLLGLEESSANVFFCSAIPSPLVSSHVDANATTILTLSNTHIPFKVHLSSNKNANTDTTGFGQFSVPLVILGLLAIATAFWYRREYRQAQNASHDGAPAKENSSKTQQKL